MTLYLTLLAHMAHSENGATYALSRLALDRKPRNRAEREEIALFRDLAPVLRRFPGDAFAIRCHCPPQRLGALDYALALPDWWLCAAEPLPALVARWSARGSEGWQLPCLPPEEAA